MSRNKISIVMGIALCMQLAGTVCPAANRLLYEHFDNPALDSRLYVFDKYWTVLDGLQYRLDAVGRNGSGHCFSSGTVSEAYPCWVKNVPSPWPTNELYVSYWMRYPRFVTTDPVNENIKIFYPHWDGVSSYVHYALTGPNVVYYSAMAQGSMVAGGRWLSCPGMTDGRWHHYEFYVNFGNGVSLFWYDGVAKVDDVYGPGRWTNRMYYISAPSMDAEDPGLFMRQVDDLEVWDGMP